MFLRAQHWDSVPFKTQSGSHVSKDEAHLTVSAGINEQQSS